MKMKTLDEVIEQHEYCIAVGEWACGDCRCRDKDGFCRIRENTLPHLKEYRELLQKTQQLEDNPPLTWDELKEMEGKPVWLDVDGWLIIDHCGNDYFSTNSGALYFRKNDECFGDYGTDWTAYRKERKDGEYE